MLVSLKLTLFHEHNLPLFGQNRFNDFVDGVIHHPRVADILRRVNGAEGFVDTGWIVEILLDQQQPPPSLVGQAPDFSHRGDALPFAQGFVKFRKNPLAFFDESDFHRRPYPFDQFMGGNLVVTSGDGG